MEDVNRATALFAEAYRLAPEARAYRAGDDGAPSRFASILLDLLNRDGGEAEMSLSNGDFMHLRSEAPDARWYRAVFRCKDGSFCAVWDGGAEIAASEDEVIRDAFGRFSGVGDMEDVANMRDVLERYVARAQVFGTADPANLSFGSRSAASFEDHPLRGLGRIVAEDDENTLVMTADARVELIPRGAQRNREIVDHVDNRIREMVRELGIDADAAQSEISGQRSLHVQAAKAYQEAERIVAKRGPLPEIPSF